MRKILNKLIFIHFKLTRHIFDEGYSFHEPFHIKPIKCHHHIPQKFLIHPFVITCNINLLTPNKKKLFKPHHKNLKLKYSQSIFK